MSCSRYNHNRLSWQLALLLLVQGVCLLALKLPLRAQTPRVDSLRAVLNTAKQDTVRVNTLLQLLWDLRVIDPVQAISFGREALRMVKPESALIFPQDRTLQKRAEIYRFLGVAYRNAGEYGKAAAEVYAALDIDLQRGDSLEIGHSYNTLARIFLLQKNTEKAASFVHRAVAIAEHLGDEKLLAFALFNLADVYFERGDYALALATANKAVSIRRKRGENGYVADIYLAIAKNLAVLKRFDEAQTYVEQSLEIYRTQGIPYNQAVGNNSMAKLAFLRKRPREASEYAVAAMRIANSVGAKALEKEAVEMLAECYAALGAYQAAFTMNKRADELEDSIVSERGSRQQALLDVEYETRLKEQKIQTFERERRNNTLAVIVIVVLLTVVALLLYQRYRQRELIKARFTQDLLQRAENLADTNDELRFAQLDLQESHLQLSKAMRELESRNDELRDLNQEKNMILGMVSHDLKNPIVAVQGLAEMMATEDFAAEQYKEFAQVIKETSNRMFGLVKNFLDVARAEEGRLRIMLIQFDIGDVVELTLKNYEQQAAKKNIQIHYVKPITPATVYADESLTLQVLDNLISNALKYTAPGKDVAVDIQVVQVLRHNVTLFNNEMNNLDESAFVQCVRVSVTDEGPGLTDQDKTKLFGKFARLSAQPTGGESSTGLGLAITKRLIETMNGRIWCESEYGFGSRFTFELPSEAVS